MLSAIWFINTRSFLEFFGKSFEDTLKLGLRPMLEEVSSEVSSIGLSKSAPMYALNGCKEEGADVFRSLFSPNRLALDGEILAWHASVPRSIPLFMPWLPKTETVRNRCLISPGVDELLCVSEWRLFLLPVSCAFGAARRRLTKAPDTLGEREIPSEICVIVAFCKLCLLFRSSQYLQTRTFPAKV